MTVLVAYGTTNGSTGEIADWIGDQLRAAGLHVEIRRATDVRDVSGYEAVVLGGAVYAAAWHQDCGQFAGRFAAPLASRPVWLFSSGPLDTSAEETDVPPTAQAQAVLQAVHARGHVTFGGRASDELHGRLGPRAHSLRLAGHSSSCLGCDFRNSQRVRAWAGHIAADLRRVPSH